MVRKTQVAVGVGGMGHGSLPAGRQQPAPASVAGGTAAAPRFAAEPPAAASLVRHQRWQALSPVQRRGLPPLSPDLVIELATDHALCAVALAPALGQPQVWRATQSAHQTRELREVKKARKEL
jgi:hypothetical protein